MAESWFILPLVEETVAGNTVTRPKYISGIDGASRSGNVYTINGTERYVVRVEADTAALDTLAAEKDVSSIWGGDATKADVEQYLNDKFGVSRSFSEWSEKFLAGDMSNNA